MIEELLAAPLAKRGYITEDFDGRIGYRGYPVSGSEEGSGGKVS